MTEQTTTPRTPIVTLWPGRKACLSIEDATHLDRPKIRIAIIPANGNSQGPADFYLDLSTARALFWLLRSGSLADAAARKNKNNDAKDGFDCYAKVGTNGRRTLTIKNKPDGIGIRIAKDNGEKAVQTVYLSAFQTIELALTICAYIAALPLREVAGPEAPQQ